MFKSSKLKPKKQDRQQIALDDTSLVLPGHIWQLEFYCTRPDPGLQKLEELLGLTRFYDFSKASHSSWRVYHQMVRLKRFLGTILFKHLDQERGPGIR